MSITQLATLLFQHVGLLIAGAFILLTLSPVQELNFRQQSVINRIFLVLFFGFFGVLGTYSGNAIFDSIANLRAMAVIPAGLFGGPIVGFGAGIIAGGHRFFIDPWGFSSVSCAVATIIEGVGAGYIHHYYKEKSMDWRFVLLITFIGEFLHMGLVLLFSRPFDQAAELVKVIAFPMIAGNMLGAALFIHILKTLYEFRERKESVQAQRIFDIANSTVRHLRDGLNMESAQATARIIQQRMDVVAVAITDTANVLAHVGLGDDHHLPGKPLRTESTRQVIDKGIPIFHKKKSLIGCNHPSCPFYSAIIVPLRKGTKIVGTLKFYGTKEKELNNIQLEIAKGLTDLFSLQLELEDIQIKDRLLSHAEIRHLQAQINPHFLFNSLNTIASFCRTAPTKARELILDLSLYMRKNLDSSRGFIRLEEELEQVNSYLTIEKARFGDRIRVSLNIEPGCEDWPIPPLIIQPLIENAIRHGISVKEDGGTVTLTAKQRDSLLEVTVEDDGAGMRGEVLKSLLARNLIESPVEGIGLRNSNQRLVQIYGPEYFMNIVSRENQGTRIFFRIPPLQNVPGLNFHAKPVEQVY